MLLIQGKKFKILSRPIKIHEAILFYFAICAFWHYIFSSWPDQLPNITYLEYPATAATTLQIIKYLDPQEFPTLNKFMGASISRPALLEIFFAIIILVSIGIGAWALLVFLEAKFISVSWSYDFWNLIDASSFNSTKWSPSWIGAYMISAGLVGPISEEIIFRGLILRNLTKTHSIKNAIFISSLIFALLHLNHSFLGTFFHSIIFSILALRLSSIYASIIAHAVYNSVTTIFRLSLGISLVAEKSKIADFSYWQGEFFLLILGLSLGIAYIYFYIRNPRLKSSSVIHGSF